MDKKFFRRAEVMSKKFFALILVFFTVFNFLSVDVAGAATDEEKTAKKERKAQKKKEKELLKAHRKTNILQVEQWAQNGDLQAQIILYYAYSTGQHVKRNAETAAQWKATVGKDNENFLENFIPIAYHKKKKVPLQEFYGFAAAHSQLGEGVPVNYDDVVRWAQLGASENDPLSLAILGTAYYTGRGLQQDYAKALEFFKRADTEPIALYHLSDAYAHGNGVDKDLQKSKFYSDYLKLVRQPKIDKQTEKNMRKLKKEMEAKK
ncbi:MAG: sel1 repeat family protein [Selenomonadaceae bacterium]|nr:sel1 repeat family protein [Selenomonadaceae bacterium]